MIDAQFLFQIDPSGLVKIRGGSGQDSFAQAISACLETTTPQAIQIRGESEPLSICVCPFLPALSYGSKVDEMVFSDQKLVSVFIGAPAVGAISTQLLRDTFALSAREAEVCARLVAGGTPAQIATDTGRSEKTVRNQIHMLHDKIGVKSTRELGDALAVFRTVGAMFAGEHP